MEWLRSTLCIALLRISLEFLLLQVVVSRDIFVSRDRYSNDTTTCGNVTQPCASLKHAVQISRDLDTILLDANYEFNHTSNLTINKNIKITSFRETNSTRYSKMTFNFLPTDEFVFEIGANLSLSRLSFTLLWSSSFWKVIIFKLVEHVETLRLVNCIFVVQGHTHIFDIYDITYFDTHINHVLNIELESVKFIIQNDNRLHRNIKNVNPMKNKRFHEMTKQLTIKALFTNCSFNNSITLISGQHVNFDDCYFYNSQIGLALIFIDTEVIQTDRLVIGDSIFNDTYVFVRYAVIDDFSNGIFFKEHKPLFNQSSYENALRIGLMSIRDTIFDGTNRHMNNFQLDINGLQITMKVNFDSCIFKNAKNGALNLKSTETQMHNVTYLDNRLSKHASSSRAAALTSKDSYVNIKNCSFINNSAAPQAGSFYIELKKCNDSHKCKSLAMSNTKIIAGNSPLLSLAVKIQRSEYLFTVVTFHNVSIKCPVNNIKTWFYNLNEIQIYCVQCTGDTYNAGTPAYVSWDKESKITDFNPTCYPCPYQASCFGNIRSKGNYWGYSNSSGGVHFILCPPSYCCSSLSKCISYNTCMNNRKGRLCGGCQPGHSISLIGPNKCVLSEKCNVQYFWIGYVALVILCCLFVLYYKDVFLFVRSCLKKRKQTANFEDINSDASDDISYHLLSDEIQENHGIPSSASYISGLLKTAFFFYQTASIIRVNASAKNKYKIPIFIDFLSSIFYVKIDIRSSSTIDVCPLHTSNVVLVDFIRASLVCTCLLILITFIFVLSLMRKFSTFHHKFQAFLRRLKGAYLQFLLLGYIVIATFCLQPVYCVNFNEKSYLYVQAESIECYQPWQKFIISFIVFWVAPFPIVIYINCRLLRSLRMTTNQFLFASTLPPLTFYYVAKQAFFMEDARNFDEAAREETAHVLSILNEPFQAFQNGDRLIWEPILLYRRLLLLTMTTFISSPIEKLYPAGALLLIYTIHVYFQPFAESMLNKLQSVIFTFLGLLTLVNLFWAFTNTVDFMQDPKLKMLGEIFLFLELFILLGPIIFCFVYIVFYKTVKYLWKCISRKQE